jgi:hypothetical protein
VQLLDERDEAIIMTHYFWSISGGQPGRNCQEKVSPTIFY